MIAFALAFAIGVLRAPVAHAATIVHTNDVMGELEPCGCRSNPLGGIARKANFLAKLPDRALLQLDAGDLLFATDTVPELLAKQSELQASYLLKAHEQLGHDAVVPGEKDFALGYRTFEKLRKGTKIRFLAANLKKRSGGRAFEPHEIFARKEGGKTLRIGVFGLVGDSLSWPKELQATSALAAAKAEVAALRGKADVIVALTHQGYEKDVELANAVPGIDLIVGGHTQSFLQKPVKIAKTWIYQSSFRNQYVGVIPLATRQDPETYRLVGLDAGYDSPAEQPSKTDQLVREFKSAIAAMNTEEEKNRASQLTLEAAGDPSRPKFQTFNRCAECHLKQFDFWRKTNHAGAFHPLREKEQSRNKECLSCHTVGLGDAKGFQDVDHLIEVARPEEEKPVFLTQPETDSFLQAMHKADSLKSPIPVPGRTEALPVRRAIATINRAWTPVQCENCHGPGQDHPFGAPISRKVENTTCLKCHTADRAPEWYSKSTGQPDWEKIQAKRALITCPAGELSPEEIAD